MENEKILCAAIWFKDFPMAKNSPANINKGLVLCGYRHVFVSDQMTALTKKHLLDCGTYLHGFLTSYARFLDRKQAAKLYEQTGGVGYIGEELYSEDLY